MVTTTTPPVAENTTCTSPLITDDAGDATKVIEDTPLPSEPALDIVSGDITWDDTAQAATFSIGVLDLADTEPTLSTGVAFDFNFSYEGVSYFILASRDATNGPSAYIGVLDTTGRVHKVDGLDATFDADTNLISIVVPNSKLAGTELTPFVTGDQINGLGITSRRQVSVAGRGIIADADDATTKCGFVVGGASTPPDPQPFPEATPPGDGGGGGGTGGGTDATLADGESFTTDMTTTYDTSGIPGVDGYTCSGPDDVKCFTYRVAVDPSAATSMNVWLDPSLDSVVLDDWDVRVYDADGNEVEDSLLGTVSPNAGPQTATEIYGLTFDVAAPATYTIVVDPFDVASDVTMTVHADLGDPNASAA